MAQPAKRVDPEIAKRPRAYDGADYVRLVAPDPTKDYVGVFHRDQAAFQRYLAKGYIVEEYGEQGISQLVGRRGKVGEQVEVEGHILMSIDKLQKAALDKGAMEPILRIEERIIDKKEGLPDETRGIPRKHFRVANETGPLERIQEV